MKPSSIDEVRELYEASADSYAEMMDAEINLPLYSDVLSRLHQSISNFKGHLIDTACGSGHMLALFHDRYDHSRPLFGVDLSPKMVSIARKRLGKSARIVVGDMRQLSAIETGSAAAVINYFALHHLDPKGVSTALLEWSRVLIPGGQLLVAAWEGSGTIDYGDDADITALKYRSEDLTALICDAGFAVNRCTVEPVEALSMDAVYLEAIKQ